MRTNPLLKEMTLADLQRRYNGSLVRYNGQMVLVDDFTIAREGFKIVYTIETGRKSLAFDFNLLDIERPRPRWIYRPEEKKAYYINYLFDRQWHRGFCRSNTQLLSLWPKGGANVKIPSVQLFTVLDGFYTEPFNTIKCSVKDVNKTIADTGIMQLSPYVVISLAGNAKPVVYYREKCIGYFGEVESLFAPEMKELVGDYRNEDNVRTVPSGAAAVKKDERWDAEDDDERNGLANILARAHQGEEIRQGGLLEAAQLQREQLFGMAQGNAAAIQGAPIDPPEVRVPVPPEFERALAEIRARNAAAAAERILGQGARAAQRPAARRR